MAANATALRGDVVDSERQHLRPGAKLTSATYWERDRWDASDTFFEQFMHSEVGRKWRSRSKRIDFTCLPAQMRSEVKRYFAHQLVNHALRPSTVFQNGAWLRCLAAFLASAFPAATSFGDLTQPDAVNRFRLFLVDKGVRYAQHPVSTLDQVVRFVTSQNATTTRELAACSDDEMLWLADTWDASKILGVRVAAAESHSSLSFLGIPEPFRPAAKWYIRLRASVGISWSHCYRSIKAMAFFCSFLQERYPSWRSFASLSRADVEAFLAWFLDHWANLHGQRWTASSRGYLGAIRQCLTYLQEADRPEAPTTPVALLFWKRDFGPQSKPTNDQIRYIPEGVLQQLEACLERLRPVEYIPIVMLLRASGWRISDVLNLRYDTCLERTELGWYLHGDIVKTQVLNHRVPITDQVAAVVKAVAEETKERSTPEDNPDRLLFVRLDGRRRGRPPLGVSVASALNHLATTCSIRTDQGELFHFGNHAFRHTKAVELINNGMSLLHVQKWLAHKSPEMTLRYARILDETLRQAWVEATRDGLFRLDGTGGMRRVDLEDLANEDQVEWEYIRTHNDAVRMAHGFCLKPLKLPCPAQEEPCLSCRNLCTTPEFLPEFERQIAGTKALIAEGKARGRVIWVQKNEALLGRLEPIAQVLREHKTHHTGGKRAREFVGQERAALEDARPPQV